jgi:hypothetical protein
VNSLFRKECDGLASEFIRDALAATRWYCMETNNTASTKIDGSKVRFWAKRTQAQEAARSIGWAPSCVCKVETRFQIGYALSMGADRDPYTGGPFLSRERFAELYYQRNPAP